MKILFIRTCFKISGAEIYNLQLLKQLKNYHNFSITLCTNYLSLVKTARKLGIRAEHSPWLIKEVGTKKDLLWSIFISPIVVPMFVILFLLKQQSNTRYDIICLQSMSEKVYFTLVFKILGYKVVWIEHGPLYASQVSRIIKILYSVLSNFVDKIIAVSFHTKTDLEKLGVRSNKIKVIYIGVDISVIEINKTSKNNFCICFLGTITKEKGIDDFIDTAEIITRSTNRAFFKIIGNGPDLSLMKSRVAALGLENKFIFTGYIKEPLVNMSNIDIFLFPTKHYEGISMSILEAQAMGIIVFTRDIGGNKEIINNRQTGYLYADWDSKKVAVDILHIMKRQGFRTSLKRRARENILKRFNIYKQSKKFYHFFVSL